MTQRAYRYAENPQSNLQELANSYPNVVNEYMKTRVAKDVQYHGATILVEQVEQGNTGATGAKRGGREGRTNPERHLLRDVSFARGKRFIRRRGELLDTDLSRTMEAGGMRRTVCLEERTKRYLKRGPSRTGPGSSIGTLMLQVTARDTPRNTKERQLLLLCCASRP